MLNTEFKFGQVFNLANEVNSSEERVVFHRVFENENGGIVLLAFRAGQGLDTHIAQAEVMVSVLEGEIDFTMLDQKHRLSTGQSLLMGAGVPHSVEAISDAKVMLVKIKP